MESARPAQGRPHLRPVQVGSGKLLDLHAADPARYPVLLESTAVGAPLGRFDILLACPSGQLILDALGQLESDVPLDRSGSFLKALDRWWSSQKTPVVSSPVPFTGGWFLFLGYELGAQIEPSLRLPPADQPVACALRVPAAFVHDHSTGQGWLVVEEESGHLMETLLDDLARLEAGAEAAPERTEPLLQAAVTEELPVDYLTAIEDVLQHIGAGDVYQANLSRGWHARVAKGVTAADVYRRLRLANPGPFAGVAVLNGRAIVSSSPERLLEVRDRRISTRPIAGTRPRADNTVADRGLARELRQHPKEQAEHVMLLDLERNDLGRVCEPGSVEVDEFMTVESYAHVHHIVSSVRGVLRPDVTPGEAIAAVFPGGTITGCPKIRCMQIIGDLEKGPRGVYTGSMGYLNRDGSMDLNILIRTLELRGNELSFRAGAGIVADSIGSRELEETRAKARGMLRAIMGSDAW